jgi:hypothetical protein
MMASAEDMTGQGAFLRRPARRNGWFEAAGPEGLVLARHWPPRFDIRARTTLPLVHKRRLALQVRQDLWRALKDLRGFSPVVQLCVNDRGLDLVAGGRMHSPAPQGTEARISALLDAPAYRDRWLSWARERAA